MEGFADDMLAVTVVFMKLDEALASVTENDYCALEPEAQCTFEALMTDLEAESEENGLEEL